eukprot:GHUV01004430.1.p1 GENE.GHUV01004430.1~~GHUV01004430.1.p1  ORF type:complete len:219 (+),score=52.32 GHUV01004430.1:219-875(+)
MKALSMQPCRRFTPFQPSQCQQLQPIPAPLRPLQFQQSRGSALVPRMAASGAAGLPSDANANDAAAGIPVGQPRQKKTILQHIKYFFVGVGLDKERLKALGMGAFASYGFISNLNYGTCLGMAWLAFVKKYGVAPTAPGQWKVFLAFYAGLWAMQNFARPLRISLALAMAPAFDKAITTIGVKLNIDKKWAFGIFLLGMAAITTTTLFGTIYLLGGFP